MKILKLVSILSLGWLAAGVFVPLRAGEPAVTAALNADRARLTAMMAGDGVALGRVMSEQLRFAHSDGRVESKAEYVQNVIAGDTAYADVRTSEVETIQISPDVVAVFGVQQMRKRFGSEWSDITLRYLAVYRNEAGAWRMIAWQSARPPAVKITNHKLQTPKKSHAIP